MLRINIVVIDPYNVTCYGVNGVTDCGHTIKEQMNQGDLFLVHNGERGVNSVYTATGRWRYLF